MDTTIRTCNVCGKRKRLETGFYQCKTSVGGYFRHCKKCQNRKMTQYINGDHRIRLLASSRNNARLKGLVHTIKLSDIPSPTVCKYLGVKLDYSRVEGAGRLPFAPSIDRIDSTLGYVPGNVQVISDLANRMKQNATVEQLLDFAYSVIREHG